MSATKMSDFDSILAEYTGQVNACLNDVLEEVAEQALDVVSNEAKSQSKVVNSGRDWSDYIAEMHIVKELDKFGTPHYIVCVGGDKYRLTHLLENGHATRNGGRTRAFPHFAKGQEWLDKDAEEILRKKLEAMK